MAWNHDLWLCVSLERVKGMHPCSAVTPPLNKMHSIFYFSPQYLALLSSVDRSGVIYQYNYVLQKNINKRLCILIIYTHYRTVKGHLSCIHTSLHWLLQTITVGQQDEKSSVMSQNPAIFCVCSKTVLPCEFQGIGTLIWTLFNPLNPKGLFLATETTRFSPKGLFPGFGYVHVFICLVHFFQNKSK